MTARTRGGLSIALGGASIALTLAVWVFIFTRPRGSFHDQGGMFITLILFPVTAAGWLVFGLPAVLLGERAWTLAAGDREARELGLVGIGAGALAGLLSLGTCVLR